MVRQGPLHGFGARTVCSASLRRRRRLSAASGSRPFLEWERAGSGSVPRPSTRTEAGRSVSAQYTDFVPSVPVVKQFGFPARLRPNSSGHHSTRGFSGQKNNKICSTIITLCINGKVEWFYQSVGRVYSATYRLDADYYDLRSQTGACHRLMVSWLFAYFVCQNQPKWL